MDFPCWDPDTPLNFKGIEPAKDIMVIGIDPGIRVRTDIHIAYELGMHKITPEGKYDLSNVREPKPKSTKIDRSLKQKVEILQEEAKLKEFKEQIRGTSGVKFWIYFKSLFNNNLEYIKKNIYITDICKCLDSNKEIIQNCFDLYFLTEFRLINPNLIIIQGNDPYQRIKDLFNISEEDEILIPDAYKIMTKIGNSNFPKIAKKLLTFEDPLYPSEPLNKEIYFVKIYHTTERTKGYWKGSLCKLINFFKEFVFDLLKF